MQRELLGLAQPCVNLKSVLDPKSKSSNPTGPNQFNKSPPGNLFTYLWATYGVHVGLVCVPLNIRAGLVCRYGLSLILDSKPPALHFDPPACTHICRFLMLVFASGLCAVQQEGLRWDGKLPVARSPNACQPSCRNALEHGHASSSPSCHHMPQPSGAAQVTWFQSGVHAKPKAMHSGSF